MLPTAAIIVPLFIVMRVLGLLNTYAGLIVVYLILTLPVSVWMLIGYFRSIPVDIEEAATVDGASRLGILLRITFPLSLPGVVAVLIYSFISAWNEFIFALCFALDSRVRTLPISLADFSTEFNTDWGAVMAASMVVDDTGADHLPRHAAALHQRPDERCDPGLRPGLAEGSS